MAIDGTIAAKDQGLSAASEAPATERDWSLLGMGLALLLTLGFFWTSVSSFTNTWGRYDYAHGWLAPLLVGWLVWNDRASFLRGLRERKGGDPLLLVPVLGLTFFWFLSTVTYIQLFHQTAFVLLMVCWGLYVFGRTGARTVIVSGMVVLMTMPLWDPFLPLLRRVTTAMSGLMVTVLRVPAEIDGDLIRLPAGTFEIADGCAGLNYLLSALVIGLVYAEVLVRGTRARLAVVGLAAAVALVANWIRVAALVVVGHVSEMQATLVKEHVGFGWVVFAIGLVLFFFLAPKIEGWVAKKSAGRAAPGPAEDGGSAAAAAEPVARAAPNRAWAHRLLVVSGVAVLGPVFFLGFSALPSAEVASPGLSALVAGAGWEPVAGVADSSAWQPDYRGAQQHEQVRYTDGAALVHGDRFVYHEQEQNAKLIGWPNRIAPSWEILDEQVVGPVDPAGRLRVRQAIVRTSEGVVLSWYWYRVGGVSTFTPTHAKALEIPAFLTRQRVSELIAFSSPCGPEDCRSAFEALAGLMGAPLPPAADSTGGAVTSSGR